MQLSQFELEGMGKEASAQYLMNKVPLNETIIKIAEANSLNPHQVARICEAANQDVYNQLWGMTKNGQFTFEMADQEKIAERLSTNTTEMDVLMEEGILPQKLASFLPVEDVIETSDRKEKTASFNIPERQHSYKLSEAFKLIENLESLNKEASYRLITLNLHRNKELDDMTSMLKEAALRDENVCLAYVAANNAFPEKTAEVNQIFGVVLNRIKPFVDSHAKVAGKQFTENAFGDTRSRAVGINRHHAIIKHINNILDDNDNINLVEQTRGYIVDKIEEVKDKLVNVKRPDSGDLNGNDGRPYGEDTGLEKKEANFAWDVYSMAAPMIFNKKPGISMAINTINSFKPTMGPAVQGIKPIGQSGFSRPPLAGQR